MTFESKLIKLGIVKAAKFVSQAPERSNQAKSAHSDISGEIKSRLLREVENLLCLALRVVERISYREEIFNQIMSTIERKSEVTNPVRNFKCPTNQISTGSQMSPGRHDIMPKGQIGASAEAVQATLLD